MHLFLSLYFYSMQISSQKRKLLATTSKQIIAYNHSQHSFQFIFHYYFDFFIFMCMIKTLIISISYGEANEYWNDKSYCLKAGYFLTKNEQIKTFSRIYIRSHRSNLGSVQNTFTLLNVRGP